MSDNSGKIKVISKVGYRCGIDNDDLRIHRRWNGYDTAVFFDKEIFDELIYTPGFKYMLNTGILYIDDMEVKKQYGLEPEEATEPTNIVPMDIKVMDRLWNIVPLAQFKLEIKKFSHEQLAEFAEYAIGSHKGDMQKAKVLSDASGYDIMNGIKLDMQAEEDAGKKA